MKNPKFGIQNSQGGWAANSKFNTQNSKSLWGFGG
jgi:hypothetical protein